jgi:hypothetical protein
MPALAVPRRAPTPYEVSIMDDILEGRLDLDQPPKFLKKILSVAEMALFGDQMKANYGFLQLPLKVSMKLTNEMSSLALGKLFFPKNPKKMSPRLKSATAFDAT